MQQQQQNIIKNPKSPNEPQAKGPNLNDRDRINDLLSTEKYLTDNLNVFAREASHRALHNDVMRALIETHQNTRDIFNLMFQKGWYTLEGEEPQKIADTHRKFQNYANSQFPYGQGGMIS